MPVPNKKDNEKQEDFLSRCMSDPKMREEYDYKQRLAVCMQSGEADNVEPNEEPANAAVFIYEDPRSGELYHYSRMGTHRKNGRTLVFVKRARSEYIDVGETSEAAEYQGKKVQLSKPFRTPKGPKKFSVYVKNEKGNVVKVNFGDPNMEIKRDDPERRKSFRARHKCDNPGPKWKPRYWSCKMWSGKNVKDIL